MEIYKFGGASVRDSVGVRNLGEITGRAGGELWIVVSALGKTTNALERVVAAFFDEQDYLTLIGEIEEYHLDVAGELIGREAAISLLSEDFDLARNRLLSFGRERELYDFVYDQVVSMGELWSTRIVEAYLSGMGYPTLWLDIRSMLLTDSRYRDANIEWETSSSRLLKYRSGEKGRIVVTQGFIGGTADGYSTTLGREGSDFTAAVLANILDAESVTIWKDVPGVLSADPGWLPGGERLERISYKEAVELSFSGAKVIHPKTIKPLHNKSIPLFVKSFLDPESGGTLISSDESYLQAQPVFVRKENQVLVSLIPKDFSFVIGDNLGKLFGLFYQNGIKTNLVQASAVSIAVCIDNEERRIAKLTAMLEPDYKILVNTGVEIITIRHYDNASLDKVTKGRPLLIE